MLNVLRMLGGVGLAAMVLAAAAGASPEPPGGNSATLPCRQPQLAADGDAVYLTCGEGGTVFVAASDDGGTTFGTLRRVATVPSLALGAHRGPRVAIANAAIVVSAVVAKVGGGKDGNLVAWRSTDRGRTWSAATVINDVADAAREGLHAMAARGHVVAAAWLDLRRKGTRLYAALSQDGGRTWSPDILAYESPSGTICQCCHPSLAITPDGGVLAMFRNEVAGHRDLYLAQSVAGGFGRAQKLGDGTWPLDACPMDGGGLAVDASGRIATVWRREQTIYLDTPSEPEIEVGRGVDPAVVSTPEGPVVAWTTPEGLTLAAPHRASMVLDSAGRFVSLARTTRGTVAAWEHGVTTVVRVIQDAQGDRDGGTRP